LFCKLKTGSADSTAASFTIELVLDEPGFSCPWPAYGTQVANVASRGVDVPMFYSDTSLLASHGTGQSVTNVVCTP
jgi:hypothetical protein